MFSMITDFKPSGKDSDLFDTLFAHFGKTMNLACIKFLSKMIKAIVILRTVNFAKLSTAFGGKADSLSSMRRIQRFMSGCDLDFSLVARLHPKKGNSNTQERIDLMERYVALFGKSSIGCLVADREFVGGRWIGWLNDNRIPYHVRIRENFWVHNPPNGSDFTAFWAFQCLAVGQSKCLYGIYLVNGQYCYLSAA